MAPLLAYIPGRELDPAEDAPVVYLLAYDVADPARLRRVARFLEKHALRCQKSVFLFRGDTDAVVRLLDELVPLLDLREDVVTAWKLSKDQPPRGLVRGTGAILEPAAAVLLPGQRHFLEEDAS